MAEYLPGHDCCRMSLLLCVGLGPLAGLYGSIFVGFFAAVFGGKCVTHLMCTAQAQLNSSE